MAADVPTKSPPENPCCIAWKDRLAEMKKKRDCLRQAVGILQPELDKAQNEIISLKKETQEEKARADAEKENKEKELATRVSLENEISTLKSEISSLHERLKKDICDRDEEAKLLQEQASEGEKEISRLKELLEKEKLRADNSEKERKKAAKELKNTKAKKSSNEEVKDLKARISEGKKEITQLKKLVEKEKRRAESESKKAESEKKKAEEYFAQLEILQNKANETDSELVSLSSKLEKVSKKLEVEKQKTRKRADSGGAKAKEQSKLAEESIKKAEEEKARAESLSQQLVVAKQEIEELQKEMKKQKAISLKKHAEDLAKVEEQRKLVEANKRMVMDEKSRADHLALLLQEAKLKIEDLQKQEDELLTSRKLVEISPASAHKDKDAATAEVRILKKELKFEKKRMKHAKQVAKLEKLRKDVLQEELGRLKLEFVHLSSRLNLLDQCFQANVEGTDNVRKMKDCTNMQYEKLCCYKPSQGNLQSKNDNPNLYKVLAASDPQNQVQQLSSRSERDCSEFASGTDYELESLIGGFNKKLLQRPRINSSATSFSDGRFVPSQGKGEFSVTTSAEIAEENLNGQPTNSDMTGKFTRMRNKTNQAMVAENSPQSPCADATRVVDEHHGKRKRMVETVESIEYLYSDSKKLHSQIEEKLGVLRGLLVRKTEKPLEKERTSLPDAQGGSHANHEGALKKRKISHEKNTIMQLAGEPKRSKKRKLESKGSGNPKISGETSEPGNILMGTPWVSSEKTSNSAASGHEKTLILEEAAARDYMKLLELEKSDDEEYYKMAREMPLTPTLPEIDFQDSETVTKDKGDVVRNTGDDLQGGNASVPDTRNSAMAVDVSGISSTRGASESKHDHIPRHCVVFSNIKDRSSIVRIFHATKNCIDRCPSVTQKEWVTPELLLALRTEEDLLLQEKVCVLLSLLLLNFSMVAAGRTGGFLNKDSSPCLDSFARHIGAVIDNADARIVFAELLDELLRLLQDLLLHRRMLYCDISSEVILECDSRINVLEGGVNVVLSDQVASADQIEAGSVILASLCTAVDRTEIIWEASFDILYEHSYDTSLLLTILHVFGYVTREKLFSSVVNNVTMTVLKSVVLFLEKKHISATMKDGAEFHQFQQCPFSNGAASLEVALSMLLEVLQKFAQSGTMQQNLGSDSGTVFHFNRTEGGLRHEDVQCALDMDLDASDSLKESEVCDTQSKTLKNLTLCNLSDLLSLVELLAGYTAWDWTSTNIVAPLVKFLELPLAIDFSVAVVVLLGRLGSLGVNAGGYEDREVEDLRAKLSAFLRQEKTIGGGLPIQIAVLSSLLSLLPFNFEEIIQGRATGKASSSVSVAVDLVRKWFSLLSEEQRAFSIRLLESSDVVSN